MFKLIMSSWYSKLIFILIMCCIVAYFIHLMVGIILGIILFALAISVSYDRKKKEWKSH